MKFSIIIPTWINLPYLQACIESIYRNSFTKHQIIVHVNDGNDGTLQWVQQQNILHTHTVENVGVCLAVNSAAALATTNYILYMNDDMVVAPNWDVGMCQAINQQTVSLFMLSATMVEPINTKNPCVVVQNFGTSLETFNQQLFEKQFSNKTMANWSGAFWPPNIVPITLWKKVGGFSTAFSPGMASDDDFVAKCWQAGCRTFIGVGDSFVYHFGCKSTGRVVKNNGPKQFLQKWKITTGDFKKYYLQLGKPIDKDLKDPSVFIKNILRLKGSVKLLFK